MVNSGDTEFGLATLLDFPARGCEISGMTIDISETAATVERATLVLARYGSVPQVARFDLPSDITSVQRGDSFVAKTDRGEEIVSVLEVISLAAQTSETPVTGSVIRKATSDDLAKQTEQRRSADIDFVEWQQRVENWALQLQIIDLEYTLDEQIVLYVLNQQDAETTRLALLTAAAGLGVVHVQPVSSEGVIAAASGGGGGGCGSGGCGSGGCGH